jgi:hypothetical protein
MNVVSINRQEKPVNKSLVRMLEELLERANKGELQALVGVGELSSGDTITFRGLQEGISIFTLIGALEALKIDMVNMIE